jgi:hypothetical protein
MSRSHIQPRLLNKQEAARYIGFSVSVFDRICDARPIALGDGNPRLNRYDIHDLDDWVERNKGAKTTPLDKILAAMN